RYSEDFKEQALAKVYSRGNNQSIQDVANDLNLCLQTLKTWMKKTKLPSPRGLPSKPVRPQDWQPEERLAALQKSYGLIGEDLNAWCREQGVFVHQLEQWKADFCLQGGCSDRRTLQTLKADKHRLERELLRKDKALAEAAALLVLQKKFPSALGGRGRMTAHEERKQVIVLVNESITAGARQAQACKVLGLSERTLQRWQTGEIVHGDQRPVRDYQPPHKLTALERAKVLAIANSDEFGHLPPSQIVPRLADQGRYVASESTFYRLLHAENQLAHRRSERPAQSRTKPRAICATAPNQLYSWDITYLPSIIRGQFFYLYLFMDIFSRKIVGWQVYEEESSALAGELLRDLCHCEGIQPNQLILHSDNGSPMKGATMLATLQQLGVMPSLSRPSVSNDNPYSESLFKTLKYRPNYPLKPFAKVTEARDWVLGLVEWYNNEHRHSAIRFVTPTQRHEGLDEELLIKRKTVYETARDRHPQRWSGSTRNWERIQAVHLNPDKPEANQKLNTEDIIQNKKAA
ncbi:MAG: IS3 family transposase, partial [Methylotenera sp.]